MLPAVVPIRMMYKVALSMEGKLSENLEIKWEVIFIKPIKKPCTLMASNLITFQEFLALTKPIKEKQNYSRSEAEEWA